MKLLIGLGNPGDKYTRTRHNVGFMALDSLFSENNFKHSERFSAYVSESGMGEHKVILVKPQTFMNNSGQTVRLLSDYYSIEPSDIMVIYDELALPFGTVRLRSGGESAGHNGIKSIISHLGSDRFIRLRIGISNQFISTQPADSFVLQSFSKEEAGKLPDVFNLIKPIIDKFLSDKKLEPETYKL